MQAIEDAQAQLAELQKDGAILREHVTDDDIAYVVSKWTGVPVTKLKQSEQEKLLRMEDNLHLRVIVEWDGLNNVVTNDLLLSYTPSPGTVFFLGYREGTVVAPTVSVHERSIFLKFSHLFTI